MTIVFCVLVVGGLERKESKERKESGYNIGKKTFLLIKTLPVFAFCFLFFGP
jgi:hypothetical protein